MQLVGLLPLTLLLSGGYEYPCSHYAYNIDGAFGVMSFLKAMSCISTMRKVVWIAFLPKNSAGWGKTAPPVLS